MKKFFTIILTLVLLCTVAGCGQKVESYDYPVIEIPDQNGMELTLAETTDSRFRYDSSIWTIDQSTVPYTFYYNESMLSDQACNFGVTVGEPFDYTLDQQMLEIFVNNYTTANVFITENFSELRQINGQPVIYTESSLHYTDETIDYALEKGILSQDTLESLGGREFFLNIPPMDQVTICPVIDGYLCVFTGTYFDDVQKQAILDAVAIACAEFEVL